MSDRDKSSRTLTAGQLMLQLSKVHPDTPVVMSQEDEPCGYYGVRSVDVRDMQRDNTYSGMDVYHNCESRYPVPQWNARYEPHEQVVFLDQQSPYLPVLDGEVAQRELQPPKTPGECHETAGEPS